MLKYCKSRIQSAGNLNASTPQTTPERAATLNSALSKKILILKPYCRDKITTNG